MRHKISVMAASSGIGSAVSSTVAKTYGGGSYGGIIWRHHQWHQRKMKMAKIENGGVSK